MRVGAQCGHAVHIGALVGEDKAADQQHHEDGRHDVTGLDRETAPGRDFRHEIAVVGPVDEAAEAHQKSRHQCEHGQQAQHDGLHQDQAQVIADAELHEAHGAQSRQRGQGAAGDLGDGLAQGGDDCLPGPQVLPLLGIAVAEDDGVVDGQCQLQHHGHGVGDKGYLPEQEVGTLVQQGRHAEGQQQHGNLHIGLGGEQQHQQDDDHGDEHDHLHLRIQAGRVVGAGIAGDVHVVPGQGLLHLFQGVQADLVISLSVVSDGKQGGAVPVVVLTVVEFHGLHALQGLQLVRQFLCAGTGDVVHHDPVCAEGHKLLVHGGQALPGLRLLRQIVGQVVVHFHPAAGKHTEDGQANI